MASGPGGSGDADSNDEGQAFTQGLMETSYAPNPNNEGGISDAAAAFADINQEPSGLQDFDIALEPTSLEDYDVSGQIFGIGRPSFALAGTPQESYFDRAKDAVKGAFDRQTTPSSIGGKVAGVLTSLATGNPLVGMAANQAFQAIANQEPQDPFDANNPNSPDYTGPVDLSDPVDNGGPDPYARRRYILPTPQTMAPEAPMVNNPLPLTPYDYQKQVWNGNVFTPAPIRRL